MRRFLQCWKRNEPAEIHGAGILFTDGHLVLAGYQPHKTKPYVSGIGGAKLEGETYLDTALRETLEELFGLETIPQELQNDLKTILRPKKFLLENGYANFLCSFDDLSRIVQLLSNYSIQSPLYEYLPIDLMEILFRRNRSDPYAEISHLCLLPVVNHDIRNPFVDTYFVKDIYSYANLQKK